MSTLAVCVLCYATIVSCTRAHGALDAGAGAVRDPNSGAEVVGDGRYAYRFTLLDPHTGEPSPRRAYALTTTARSHVRLPFVADEKGVYQAMTDAEGRTAVFRLSARLPDSAWDLRERVGSGSYGETFRIRGPNGKALANYSYLLVICTTPPLTFQGFSDAHGMTAYAASEKAVAIRLFEANDDRRNGDPSLQCADNP